MKSIPQLSRFVAFVVACLFVSVSPALATQKDRVPLPTAANQVLFGGTAAPLNWQAISIFTLSGTAGDYTLTFPGPLVVAPTGTAEAGLTVKMPSGATGYVFRSMTSTNAQAFGFLPNGTLTTDEGVSGNPITLQATNSAVSNYVASLSVQATGPATGFTCYSNAGAVDFGFTNNSVTGYIRYETRYPNAVNYTSSPEFHIGGTGSPYPALAIGTGLSVFRYPVKGISAASSALLWQIDQNANAQFAGYSSAVRTTSAADTATLADSLLLVNGAYAETLPTTTNPAGRVYTVKALSAGASVTNTIDGTAGYSLGANQYVQVVWSGSAFYKIGGN